MLKVSDIHTYYGESYILQGISLEIRDASVVGLLGRNGMGKTTTICSIIGTVPPRLGKVRFKEEDITGLPSYKIAQMGMGVVPQGRHIFQSLSVEENLKVSARKKGKPGAWSLEKVYSFFPILKKRAKQKGNLLSGGEQQMLAISRTLMTNPDLLLMDEPSEGLAPVVILEVSRIIAQLKEEGLSILLVEQNIPMALKITDSVYIISKGLIVYESTPDQLRVNEEVKARYLGIGS